MNKLAKLRRHASQVHFAKIHFGTSITLHSATNVRVGQYDHCNVNAWLVGKTKLHCQESRWKSFSALSDNGKCDLRLKLNLFYSFSPHIKMDTFGKSAHIRVPMTAPLRGPSRPKGSKAGPKGCQVEVRLPVWYIEDGGYDDSGAPFVRPLRHDASRGFLKQELKGWQKPGKYPTRMQPFPTPCWSRLVQPNLIKKWLGGTGGFLQKT